MSGLLHIDNGLTKMYLPVFCDDRDAVYAVLCDAMNEWNRRREQDRKQDAVSFFQIANALGRERLGCEGCFIGPEAVHYSDGQEFVFAADCENGQIVIVR